VLEAAERPGEPRRLSRDSCGGTAKLSRSHGRRINREGGFTAVEVLTVLIILGIVLGALTTLFVRGMNAELEANNRFRAQDQARLAVDRMRRELHCASAISASASSITSTLPGHCKTAIGGTTTTVVYSMQAVSTERYRLRRAANGGAAVTVADYLTSQSVFTYTAPSPTSLGKLSVDFRVNLKPAETWKTWHLVTDIVLRNTIRA
jgi:prepilin-type N-terminal cleavage/methylation domain-containing protein